MLLIAITWTPRSWGIFCGRMPWLGWINDYLWKSGYRLFPALSSRWNSWCGGIHKFGCLGEEKKPEAPKNCTCTCVLGTTRVAYKCLYYVFFFCNSFIQEITRVCAFRFLLVSRVAKQWIEIQKNWHLRHKNLCRALVAKVKLDNAKFENFHGRVNFTRVKLLPQHCTLLEMGHLVTRMLSLSTCFWDQRRHVILDCLHIKSVKEASRCPNGFYRTWNTGIDFVSCIVTVMLVLWSYWQE